MRWIAAVVVALCLAACTSGQSADPQFVGRPTPGPVPAGTRPVTYHGLTIFVPTSWATDAVRCGAPLRNTVFFGDGAAPLCGSTGRPEISEAEFRIWRHGIAYPLPDRRSIVIDGHQARLRTGTVDGDYMAELDVPDLKAMLVISGPNAGLGERLVRTAQITKTDANGCASTMPYVDLASPPTSGPADVMVAGRPSAVVLCHYLGTYLERGMRVSSTAAPRLVASLNALPTGLSEVSRSTYLPSLCRGGKDARQGDASDEEDFTIRLSYTSRPTAVVYGRLGLCGAIGFTNGTRTGQRGDAVVNLLNAAMDDQLTWPGGIHPR